MGHPNAESIEKLMSKLATEAPKRYSHGELQSFTSNFSSEVGSGAFGKVYKGQFNDGVKIAVKVLLDDGFVAETFEAEVSTIGMTSHRYLVKLYGFCFDENMKALVYEYMENGSLNDILYGNRLGMVWEKFYSIAIETAKGLSYLHDGCHKQIIHHDVKAANILLDSKFCPKVTDFGLAKLMNREDTHRTNTGMRGTMNYAAPEVCYPSFPITYKCDVYSFGMLLFEILGMRNNGPRENWFPKQVWKKFEIGQLDEFITDCGIPEKSRENAKTLSMVAFWCAQWIPTRRPSMSTVVKMLEEEMPVTTPPYPFYPSSESSMPPIQELEDSNVYPSISGERPSPEYSVPPMQEVVHSKVPPYIYSESLHEKRSPQKEGTSINNEFSSSLVLEPPQKSIGGFCVTSTDKMYTSCLDVSTPDHNASIGDLKNVPTSSNARDSDTKLELFQKKCPPGGENTIIFYSSDFFHLVEESSEVRSILLYHGVNFVERNVNYCRDSMHELERLRCYAPALFVKGRYIGRVDEVLKLEKEGKMSILFEEADIQKGPKVFFKYARGPDLMLELFEKRCPPGGENSIILYTDSKGYYLILHNGKELVSILKSYQVKFVERDIRQKSEYYSELERLLKDVMAPVLFVKGRYIGRAHEVKRMEKEGTLSILFDDETLHEEFSSSLVSIGNLKNVPTSHNARDSDRMLQLFEDRDRDGYRDRDRDRDKDMDRDRDRDREKEHDKDRTG